MKNEISIFIKETLADITGYNKDDIKLEELIIDDLGLDSMMILDFQRIITNKYKEVNPKELMKKFLSKNPTVQDVINELAGDNQFEFNEEVRDITKFTEVVDFAEYLESQKHLVPYFRVNDGIANNKISINGIDKINYSTYNYLGLNGDKRINDYVKQAVEKYGTSVSGSRLLSGEIKLHRELEEKIASFIGTEDALVQVGGHSTNVNTIGNIVNQEDLILHDALSHNSIIQGALLSHAKRKPFKHNDMKHLENELIKLRDKYRRVLIVVEGVYSMDGDICNLPELIRLKEKYGAILMVDEAHSLGTIGMNGRGVTSYYDIDPLKVDILMGTLSKSLNSCGGYIAGKAKFINHLKYNSPGFIFSVGMTPANTAAAYKTLCIMEETDDIFMNIKENAKYFLLKAKEIGANVGLSANTPIVPVIIGNSQRALEISKELYVEGVNAMPIVYPAVNENEARLRFFISAVHTKEDIDFTINKLKKVMDKYGV